VLLAVVEMIMVPTPRNPIEKMATAIIISTNRYPFGADIRGYRHLGGIPRKMAFSSSTAHPYFPKELITIFWGIPGEIADDQGARSGTRRAEVKVVYGCSGYNPGGTNLSVPQAEVSHASARQLGRPS